MHACSYTAGNSVIMKSKSKGQSHVRTYTMTLHTHTYTSVCHPADGYKLNLDIVNSGCIVFVFEASWITLTTVVCFCQPRRGRGGAGNAEGILMYTHDAHSIHALMQLFIYDDVMSIFSIGCMHIAHGSCKSTAHHLVNVCSYEY